MPSRWPVSFRTLLPVCVGYAAAAALVSWSFTQVTGRSRWTMLPAGPQHTYLNLFSVNLAIWVTWGVLAPVVFVLGRRLPIERPRWIRRAAVHAVASMVVATVHGVAVASARVVLQTRAGLDVEWWPSVVEHLFRNVDLHVPVYWGLLGLQHAVDYHRAIHARDIAAAQLETRLVEAQLQALHRQVHPHFLFNTLHAVSALIHRAPEAADRMIEHLSDLLRMTLATGTVQEVPLQRELEILGAYLDIEQVHFGPRLRVQIVVGDETRDALVPPLVLLPLAENALRHGLAPRPDGGTLRVTAVRDGEWLRLALHDDGRGQARAATRGHGVGLANTRARLETLYRGRADLEVRHTESGTIVALRVPFQVGQAPVVEQQKAS